LLISWDKSADGLRKYIQMEKMNWPALAFDKVAGATDLKKLHSGHGIPCLTILDRQGKVLAQSKSDQDGEVVLKELLNLAAKSD
jgi:hypothetical protein